MKTSVLLIVASVVLLLGCSGGVSFVPKSLTVGLFNFTPYSEKGFLFTPHSYSGDYESIGLVSVMISPSARLNKIATSNKNADGKTIFDKSWSIDRIDVNEALDSLYHLAAALGADAIVDLQINEISQSYNMNNLEPQVTIYGYKIDGFAIKRLGAFMQRNESADTVLISQ